MEAFVYVSQVYDANETRQWGVSLSEQNVHAVINHTFYAQILEACKSLPKMKKMKVYIYTYSPFDYFFTYELWWGLGKYRWSIGLGNARLLIVDQNICQIYIYERVFIWENVAENVNSVVVLFNH